MKNIRYTRSLKILLVAVIGLGSCKNKNQEKQVPTLNNDITTTIALGSCYDAGRGSSRIFEAVISNEPDVWVWLGDIIYGDTHDMAKLKDKYDELKKNSFYSTLRNLTRVIGVWDDHDYGQNDGGKFYSMKKESKEVLLDFLDISSENAINEHEGVYSSYVIGEGDKKIKFLLLDTRYFRDTLYANSDEQNRYHPNLTGDVLGEAQWLWLESELNKNDAAIHIIGSGYQIVPEEHGYEKWANFPKSRERLLELIRKKQANRTMLVSGDRHMSELSAIKLEGLPYNLYEFTSSGLTHTWDQDNPEPNNFRIGQKVVKENFGLIKIAWKEGVPELSVEIRGQENELYATHKLKF